MLLQLISLFVFIPLVAFLASLFWQNKQEKPIALIVQFTKAFYVVAAVVYCAVWIINGSTPFNQHFATLYKTHHFVFAIQFYYDHITAVYSIVGAILFFLVSTFSRYYMHRDEGYKRFFNTILFFALGYNLIIFSGNFETLFIGWEIIGLSSFLLIAFYRNRYLPVKNAFKTISNYRISDLALILAMWMMHHLTHQNITFAQLNEARMTALLQDHGGGMALFIAIMIMLAATIKSAQFPFTSWLPRAMEGPTSSSAIFYGSLSVHIGVFILLRTWPFWQDMTAIKIIIIAVGAVTGIVATLIARVQPTVKTQIAYSSAAQIGIIFIEVALGFHILALIHFAGNAFLRTYQLLVSPSVLNYLVHHQYFHYRPQEQQPMQGAKAGLYMLGIKEWNLDGILYRYLWSPFKWIGKQFHFLNSKIFLGAFVCIALTAMIGSVYKPEFFVAQKTDIAVTFLSISLAIILFTFSHRGSALLTWQYLLLAHIFIIAGININAEYINAVEILFYGSGVTIAFALGYYCLQKIKAIDGDISLNNYHGYVYEEKTIAFLFLLAAIGMLGFPITAAFVGIDVLFTYVEHTQGFLITLLALCLIFIELAAIRIFLRIFLGQHKKLNHPIAFRSS
ncbi:proton-conducting transporter transmembrane domain-containing protein [Terrimonas alba]|uniref:proton-conducting transporter transmembrane domain-containing protein n=1 Tax=Terrimonas alba TaxID=3349636 RepID=UPI0035F329F2